MPEYAKLTAEQCADRLMALERAEIICHIRPDGDTVGSAKALAELLRTLGKGAAICCADRIPDRLGFILGDDIVSSEPHCDLTPVAIDVASTSQLGAIAEKCTPVLTIDHHASATPFSDNYTVAEASSAAEALMDVIEVLEKRGVYTLGAAVAEPLYTAISSDSGCFCYSSVTPKTHMRAARLIAIGFDFSDINRRLFHTKSREQIAAEALVGSKIRTACDGRIAYVTVSEEDRRSIGADKGHFECAIDIVRTLAGAEIAASIKESEGGMYKVSLRSFGIDVAAVAAEFGGGGHIRASGCAVKADSIEEAADKLISRAALALAEADGQKHDQQ